MDHPYVQNQLGNHGQGERAARAERRAPTAVRTYLAAEDAMADASSSPAQAQAVRLAFATHNDYHYCGAVHSRMAGGSGVSVADVERNSDDDLPDDPALRSRSRRGES